jgi:hypothetical protein
MPLGRCTRLCATTAWLLGIAVKLPLSISCHTIV